MFFFILLLRLLRYYLVDLMTQVHLVFLCFIIWDLKHFFLTSYISCFPTISCIRLSLYFFLLICFTSTITNLLKKHSGLKICQVSSIFYQAFYNGMFSSLLQNVKNQNFQHLSHSINFTKKYGILMKNNYFIQTFSIIFIFSHSANLILILSNLL